MKALRLMAETKNFEKDISSSLRSQNSHEDFLDPKISLQEMPIPQPGPNELLVKVQYCGLCGSDFHLTESQGGHMAYPGLTQLPVTIGHEFSGVVVKTGEGTSPWIREKYPPGAPITSEEMVWCGECSTCRAGYVNHCEYLEEIGFTKNGAHAEFVVVPARLCWSLESLQKKFGSEAALKMGAMVEPYAVAYRALFQGPHRAPWRPGLRVLLLGAGPIGLATMELCLLGGSLVVDVLESREDRRKFATDLGATSAMAPEAWNKGAEPYDLIIDAAGSPQLCLEVAKKRMAIGGSICALARSPSHGALDPELLITKGAQIVGSQGHSGEFTFGRVIELMAHEKIRPLRLLQKIISLEEAVLRLQRQDKCAGKILVRPHREISP